MRFLLPNQLVREYKMPEDNPVNLINAIKCVQEKRLNYLSWEERVNWQFLKTIETQLLARFLFLYPMFLEKYGITLQFYK